MNVQIGPIELSTEAAGLLSVTHEQSSAWLHLGVKEAHPQWGFSYEWYDGEVCSFGLGRLGLLTWSPEWDPAMDTRLDGETRWAVSRWCQGFAVQAEVYREGTG
jgi:hypothetical protein